MFLPATGRASWRLWNELGVCAVGFQCLFYKNACDMADLFMGTATRTPPRGT